jgi:hypothetical protein
LTKAGALITNESEISALIFKANDATTASKGARLADAEDPMGDFFSDLYRDGHRFVIRMPQFYFARLADDPHVIGKLRPTGDRQ